MMPSPKDYYQRIVDYADGLLDETVEGMLRVAQRAIGNDTELLVEISVYNEKKDIERKRTEQQNKYYHKLLDIICEYTGDTHKDLHLALKVEFLSKPWVKGNREYMLVGSTKELTSKSFGKYIDRVFVWASEQGIKLPSSDSFYV